MVELFSGTFLNSESDAQDDRHTRYHKHTQGRVTHTHTHRAGTHPQRADTHTHTHTQTQGRHTRTYTYTHTVLKDCSLDVDA